IQNNVSIFEGVKIENNVFCGPSVVFTNVKFPRSLINQKKNFLSTIVRSGCTIGANSTIICGITLGKNSFVGAGSVVTKNVLDEALVLGNPAKFIKKINK
ncbi:N-acetyltransferase, partial [Alphaproteobacteria bacterium]|nr:N-acetyltransferase [Alphaproteobacteria bacterium]